MTSQNEEAEEWMRKLEKEEEKESYKDPDKPVIFINNIIDGFTSFITCV